MKTRLTSLVLLLVTGRAAVAQTNTPLSATVTIHATASVHVVTLQVK